MSNKKRGNADSLMKVIEAETARLERAGPFSLRRVKAAVRMLAKGSSKDTLRMVKRYRKMNEIDGEGTGANKREDSPEESQAITARGSMSSSDYWTEVNVTGHHEFRSEADSLDYFHWRNSHYFNYIELMPVAGEDGKVVLDYGCGPGHDTVGFGVFSKPSRLISMEVSPTSLEEARERAALHGLAADFVLIQEDDDRIPLEDGSVDTIHSSGVIHHTPDPVKILREFKRVLKPDGAIRIMIYNYDSIFVHLYVAYLVRIREGKYAGETIREAFTHCTDGENCPISNVYTPAEFLALAAEAGLEGELTGVSVSVSELDWLADRPKAILDRRLVKEHRDFLTALEFDRRGLPMINGTFAGFNGCFRLWKS